MKKIKESKVEKPKKVRVKFRKQGKVKEFRKEDLLQYGGCFLVDGQIEVDA